MPILPILPIGRDGKKCPKNIGNIGKIGKNPLEPIKKRVGPWQQKELGVSRWIFYFDSIEGGQTSCPQDPSEAIVGVPPRCRMSELLHRCLTKATTAEGDHLRHSLSWVTARRAYLMVFEDRLECRDWVIACGDIEEAVLFSVFAFPLPGHVLRVRALSKTYQFGLNRNRFWKGDLPFPVTREKGRLGYSSFSAIARLVLLAAILYWLWNRYR